MSKKTKKRNKAYQGADATTSQPKVHRYTAEKRSSIGEWWQEKRKVIKITGIVTLILFFLILIVTEVFGLIFGGA